MKEENNIGISEKIISMCNIPKEAALGFPVITIFGKNEVIIESYQGIIEYNDEIIRLRTKSGQLKVSGNKLNITYYTNDEMKILGIIDSVEYIRGSR